MLRLLRTLRSTHPQYADGWDRRVIVLIVGFYLFAVVGAFFPSWEGIALAVVLALITGFGVTVWYHRFFTHGSFQTKPWVWKMGAVAGLLSAEGPPLPWVAQHALHHQKSDTADDPHSPHFGGLLHAHLLWILSFTTPERYNMLYHRYTPRWMRREKFLLWLNASYAYWHLGLIAALSLLGCVYGWWRYGAPLYYALSFVGYGYFIRTVYVLNATWSVNSLSHVCGSQPFKEYAGDQSRNNLFVAIVALGEGWHHNHHVCPTSYRHGIRWWQIDPSAWLIWVLWRIGLASDVKPFKLPPRRQEAPQS